MGDENNTFDEGGYKHTWLSPESLLIEKRIPMGDDLEKEKNNMQFRAFKIADGLGDDWIANKVAGRGRLLMVTISKLPN